MTTPESQSGLTFGTAGLRAPVGPGPDKLNVGTVTRATAGVAAWLRKNHGEADQPITVAVASDARYGSDAFAAATAEVFAAQGFEVTQLVGNTPTPVLAWVVKNRGLTAGVQITASHNPKADNGYKLYLSGGSQLTSPADREIEAEINQQPPAADIPRSGAIIYDRGAKQGYEGAVSELVATSDSATLNARRELAIAYTPMHGVGGDTLEAVLRANGFTNIHPVAAQRWPDPEFPTVEFPNPEEPGATDMLLDLGVQVSADLLIAVDPDADRCMIGVPDGDGGYRMLTGNQTGPLLAERVLSTLAVDVQPVVATTMVSSQLLGSMSARRGWDYVETNTGFKYLSKAADDRPGELAFAYEEAIGTCPAPHVVADKDGIATALIAAVWAAELSQQQRSLLDVWRELEEEFGVFATAQVASRLGSIAEARGVIGKFVGTPPESLAGAQCAAEQLAENPADGVRLTGTPAAGLSLRVVARPSGTEPKAKFYLEVTGPVEQRELVDQTLAQLEVDIPRAVEAVAGIA